MGEYGSMASGESARTRSKEQSAVVLIDLQNEFVTPGFFKRPIALEPMLEPIEILTVAARAANHPVIWVHSEYPEREQRPAPLRAPVPDHLAHIPHNSDMLASGHAGRPCCVAGSQGAAFPREIQALQGDEDLHITKQRYSAFGETDLLEQLRARDVEVLYVCGLVTNMCVRATVVDAFFLGFEVHLVDGAVSATRPQLHRDAMGVMLKHHATLSGYTDALTRWGSVRRGLGAGDTEVWYGVLPEELEAGAFEALRDEIDWEQMRHRGGVVPRLVSLQGDLEEDGTAPLYRHPADEQPVLQGWTPVARALRDLAQVTLEQPLNHALIQRYMDGTHHISDHADKTLDIAHGSAIVGLSLGATRTITLRSKQPGPDGTHLTQRLELSHGSLFVMGWHTNQRFQHGIRRDRRQPHEKRQDELRAGGQRISMTLRHVATFLTPEGKLFGQGALRKERLAALAMGAPTHDADLSKQQAQLMLDSFGEENRSDTFDWDSAYGRGFDVLDLSALSEED